VGVEVDATESGLTSTQSLELDRLNDATSRATVETNKRGTNHGARAPMEEGEEGEEEVMRCEKK
jgi:hypothetical protein